MSKTYDNATVELAMTLSTLAYVDENRTATQQQMINEINAALEQAGYKAWQVVWGPALNADRSNLAYAARNGVTGQLAVSIRGSDFSFWLNWIEDLAAIRVVSYDQFVPSASKTAQIAFGTAIGLRQVLGMRFLCDGMEETGIQAIEDGWIPREDNPLKHAPHTALDLAEDNWNRPYSRRQACFPVALSAHNKYWPPVNRIDNIYGDRNLICSCPPTEEYATAAE